jgi:hypothetical protein
LILLGLNIGLVASSMVSFWLYYSITGILAISCGIVGLVTIYSRYKIWKTGTVAQLYNLAQENEDLLKKMKMIDWMFWGTSGFNSVVFLGYLVWIR